MPLASVSHHARVFTLDRLGKGASAPVASPVEGSALLEHRIRRYVAVTDAQTPRIRKPAPWRGRRRVADPKDKLIAIRCTAEDHAAIDREATKAGLSVSAYLRALALGAPGPRAVRRLPVERTELARLLGHIGKLGSNVNQIAKAVHTTGNLPSRSELAVMQQEIAQMRAALLKALNRDHHDH
jgi:hypothetical protein